MVFSQKKFHEESFLSLFGSRDVVYLLVGISIYMHVHVGDTVEEGLYQRTVLVKPLLAPDLWFVHEESKCTPYMLELAPSNAVWTSFTYIGSNRSP